MNLGTENPKKVGAAVFLVLIAAYLGIRGFSWAPSSDTGAAPPPSVQQPLANPAPESKGPAQILPENNIDPRLRLDLLQASESVRYRGNGRNIFRIGAEPVKVIPKPVQSPLQASAPPPGPPPIDLKFFGFASRQGGGRKVFLSQGDDVFVAGEGDIVNRRYKVVRISPASVEIEDVVNNVRQTIPLTQG